MLPDFYVCTSCDKRFNFKFREAYYYVDAAPAHKQIADADLLWVNVRPAWCKDCECVCVVEDIAPLRRFDDAYGAARTGRPVEYPAYTAYMKAPDALRELGDQLRWRMGRRHAARTLCCGGSRYQRMEQGPELLEEFRRGMTRCGSRLVFGDGGRIASSQRGESSMGRHVRHVNRAAQQASIQTVVVQPGIGNRSPPVCKAGYERRCAFPNT